MVPKSSPQVTHQSPLNGLPGKVFSYLTEAKAGQ